VRKSVLSRQEVRNVDRRAIEEYGLPGIVLMENAGRGAAELLLQCGIKGRVVICAGRGNNGGDGFVIARHLDIRGIEVRVLLFGDPATLSGDAAINYRVLSAAGLAGRVFSNTPPPEELAEELAPADWIVDALLGTGTQGTLREPYPLIIDAINAADRRVLAVDLPSGLDCDSGRPIGPCVRAEQTATFVARKSGFEEPTARDYLGEVHVIDIGVPRQLLESL